MGFSVKYRFGMRGKAITKKWIRLSLEEKRIHYFLSGPLNEKGDYHSNPSSLYLPFELKNRSSVLPFTVFV